MMNGAESLARTLVASGVDMCFANPGTSEMHFVAALDKVEDIRCVLGLFEGVVTGAADGYGRMADRPAATLLHLGPGLGNGIANLHNAQRARTPMVNIVGDHATYHRQYDAPLTSDVEGTARPYSHWVRTSKSSREVVADCCDAVIAARTPPGGIATLILPADAAWEEGTAPLAAAPPPAAPKVAATQIEKGARICVAGGRTGLILAGAALRGEGLDLAGRIAAKTGVRLLAAYSPPRIERGVGVVTVEPIPYPIDQALPFLTEFDDLLLIGGAAPVAFFAYPGKPSILTPDSCTVSRIAELGDDIIAALRDLGMALDARDSRAPVMELAGPIMLATGRITGGALGASIAALMPHDAIVVDESVSTGAAILAQTRGAARHEMLKNVGGSIGFAMPAAVGAALACPTRKTLCLQADGSAMYTLQALWTMARERLDIVTIVFANRSYGTLHKEFANVGAGAPGPRALSMLEIGDPALDWCGLAQSMGVEAGRADSMDRFNDLLRRALAGSTPVFIEVML
jgi:acetolactate synthase-1/2/3 large subunit